MKTLSLSEVKMKLSALVDRVDRLDEEIVITRGGRPIAVLVSPEEIASYRETRSIGADSGLSKEIRSGLQALRRKRGSLYTLEELFDRS